MAGAAGQPGSGSGAAEEADPPDSPGAAPRRRGGRRRDALARFVLLYAVLYGSWGVASPFFPALLGERGLGPGAIGLVLGAGTAVRLISGPLAGHLADRRARRRAVLATCTAAAALIGLAYLGAFGVWPLLLVSLAHAVTLAPLAPLADALALPASAGAGAPADGARGGRSGFEYGWVRGAGSAAFIAGSLAAGQAIGRFGLVVIVVLNSALLAVASVCACRVPDAAAGAAERAGESLAGARGARTLLAMPEFRKLLLTVALVAGSHAMHDSFAVIRWRAAGIGTGTASLLWSEQVAAEVLVFFLLGRVLLDRLGPAGAAALAAGAGVLRWAVLGATAWVPALALVEPLHGLTFALLHLACMRLMSRIVPGALTATGQTLYATLGNGVSSVAVTLASGPLYASVGPAGFWAMAGLCAAAVPVALGLGGRRAVTPA